MNRFHVKTLAVFVLIAFAAMGAFVLTDNFVPQAHADHGCIPAAIECLNAIADALEACADGVTPECIAAGITAYYACQHAWNDCFGSG
ncbi:hypothetical protein F4Y93_06510 [Candidatus Poribacteria bacterium]|nr:hypothetical protein [Candidatus Poribacteria bacterium]